MSQALKPEEFSIRLGGKWFTGVEFFKNCDYDPDLVEIEIRESGILEISQGEEKTRWIIPSHLWRKEFF